MTRAELRVELDWFCGCGEPAAAAAALLRLLRLHPLYDHREEIGEWLPDTGVEMLLLYHLAARDLTEHGGTVGGAWLTEKGEQVRDALAAEEGDEFGWLFVGPYCIHGVDVGEGCDACAAALRAALAASESTEGQEP
jgi:hypothetical protein